MLLVTVQVQRDDLGHVVTCKSTCDACSIMNSSPDHHEGVRATWTSTVLLQHLCVCVCSCVIS